MEDIIQEERKSKSDLQLTEIAVPQLPENHWLAPPTHHRRPMVRAGFLPNNYACTVCGYRRFV